MKVKIGDLKLADGTNIREINDECNKYLMCEPCPYYGDVCDGDMTDIDVEIPQTVHYGQWIHEQHEFGFDGWCCSECGTRNYNLPSGVTNPYKFPSARYCPHCGTKMK